MYIVPSKVIQRKKKTNKRIIYFGVLDSRLIVNVNDTVTSNVSTAFVTANLLSMSNTDIVNLYKDITPVVVKYAR